MMVRLSLIRIYNKTRRNLVEYGPAKGNDTTLMWFYFFSMTLRGRQRCSAKGVFGEQEHAWNPELTALWFRRCSRPLAYSWGRQVQGWKVKLSRMYVRPPEPTLYPTYCELELAGGEYNSLWSFTQKPLFIPSGHRSTHLGRGALSLQLILSYTLHVRVLKLSCSTSPLLNMTFTFLPYLIVLICTSERDRHSARSPSCFPPSEALSKSLWTN